MSSLFLIAKILMPTLEADLVLSVSRSRLFAAVSPAPNQPEKRLNECGCQSASFSGVTNDQSRAFSPRKRLLTIDAHSDELKK
jgi:hypothetical protein